MQANSMLSFEMSLLYFKYHALFCCTYIADKSDSLVSFSDMATSHQIHRSRSLNRDDTIKLYMIHSPKKSSKLNIFIPNKMLLVGNSKLKNVSSVSFRNISLTLISYHKKVAYSYTITWAIQYSF